MIVLQTSDGKWEGQECIDLIVEIPSLDTMDVGFKIKSVYDDDFVIVSNNEILCKKVHIRDIIKIYGKEDKNGEIPGL